MSNDLRASLGFVAKDAVDRIIAQWKKERPDLDLRPMALFGRFGRVAAVLGRAVEEKLGAHGLSTAEFDVLAALRRSGAPFQLTPTALAKTMMLSPGAMTNRLDRLEQRGLVERVLDREDRRSFIVGLTRKGQNLVDEAVVEHVANEKELLTPLTLAEQGTLDQLLRKLLEAHSDDR